MTREDIILNIKCRIMALKSLSPKEQEANKGNLWELEDLLGMIENDHIEDESKGLDEAADCYKDTIKPEDVDDYEHCVFYETYTEQQISDAFKAGAKWMADKMKIIIVQED